MAFSFWKHRDDCQSTLITKDIIMITQIIKCSIGVFFALISFCASAADTIKITVKTNADAAAIGFEVGGNKSGGLGKSYSGKGPSNKEYSFGFKKGTIFGDSIYCGTLLLDQNCSINLIYQDNKCIAVLS